MSYLLLYRPAAPVAVGGQVVSPFTFGRTVSGTLYKRGLTDSPYTFGSVVSGKVEAKGQVIFPITIEIFVDGDVEGAPPGGGDVGSKRLLMGMGV